MMNLTRYSTCIKAGSGIDYDLPDRMVSLKQRVNRAYKKLINDNGLDQNLYKPVYESAWMDDDFINNKFTIRITAVDINEPIEPQPNFYNINEKDINLI